MTLYRSVKLPNGLVESITEFISTQKEYGYVSIADFVKDSVRKNLAKYKQIQITKNNTTIKEVNNHD